MPGVKKGDSLAHRASESFALQESETKIKMDSRFRGNDVKRGTRIGVTNERSVEQCVSAAAAARSPVAT